MGILDTVLNGLGNDAAGGLGDLLKGQGGVSGLADTFAKAGMGNVVQSWIGQGENVSISAEQIQAVLGAGPLADFARKLGVSPEQASETLAGLLPELIDRLTPGGQVGGAEDLIGQITNKLPGGLGDMLGGFLKR